MEVSRRIVKSPFTKEQLEGVFVTREQSRNRRKSMKVLNKMPEDGKFVIVWDYNGEIQSGTYQRNGDMLMDLNEDDEDKEYDIYAMSSVFHQDSTIYIVP